MRVLLCSLCLLLSACASDIQQYTNKTPPFALMRYFEGETKAWGILENFSGDVTRRFEVNIVGRIEQDILVLDEHFTFDDGEKQFRQWRISRNADGSFSGKAGDVIGSAKGEEVGNTLRWQYVLLVPVDDTTYDIHFDDWMYRLDEKRVFNKAKMKKFGIPVGQVTLFFEKQG